MVVVVVRATTDVTAERESARKTKTMGRVFLEHINGTKLYACASCDTNLTNKTELISTRFTGATGLDGIWDFLDILCDVTLPLFRTSVSLQARRQPDLQRGPGSGDAHRTPYGPRCHVQELQGEAGLVL